MGNFWISESYSIRINDNDYRINKTNWEELANKENYKLSSVNKKTLKLTSGKRIAGIALGCLCTLTSLGLAPFLFKSVRSMFVAKKITKYYTYSDEKIHNTSILSLNPSSSSTQTPQNSNNETVATKAIVNQNDSSIQEMLCFSPQTTDLLKSKGINISFNPGVKTYWISQNCLNNLPQGNYYVVFLATVRTIMIDSQAFETFKESVKAHDNGKINLLFLRYGTDPSTLNSLPSNHEYNGINYKNFTLIVYNKEYRKEMDEFNLESINKLKN